MNTLFEKLREFADILNLGRLIFYTFAGAVVVSPLQAIAKLLRKSSADLSFFECLARDVKIGASDWWTFGILALVTGFVLSTVGFTTIIEVAGRKAAAALEAEPLPTSFAYNYPRLVKSSEKDYANWLISEYYRFVEIAALIPLGVMIGLLLLEVYGFLFLLRDAGRTRLAGFTDAHWSLVVLSATLLSAYYYLWPEVWEKRVLIPIVRAYFRAKSDLVKGIRETEKRALIMASATPTPDIPDKST